MPRNVPGDWRPIAAVPLAGGRGTNLGAVEGPSHAAARGSAFFPVLTLAETAELVQVVVSWRDEAGPHRESFTVQLP